MHAVPFSLRLTDVTVFLPYLRWLQCHAGRCAGPPAATAAPRRGGNNAASPFADCDQCSASWRRRDSEQPITTGAMDKCNAGFARPIPVSAFQEVLPCELFNAFCARRLQAQQPAANVLFSGVLRGPLAGKAFPVFGRSKLTSPLCATINGPAGRSWTSRTLLTNIRDFQCFLMKLLYGCL